MITPKTIKELVAQHRRSNPLTIATFGKTAQLWSHFFIFELPKDEVVDEVLEKYSGPAFDMRALLNRVGKEVNGEWPEKYDGDWRHDLVLSTESEDSTFTREVRQLTDEDGAPEEIDVVKLVGKTSKEVRYVRAELFDFFSDQMLRPMFKVHPGTRADGRPRNVSIWEGKELCGVIAVLDIKS